MILVTVNLDSEDEIEYVDIQGSYGLNIPTFCNDECCNTISEFPIPHGVVRITKNSNLENDHFVSEKHKREFKEGFEETKRLMQQIHSLF